MFGEAPFFMVRQRPDIGLLRQANHITPADRTSALHLPARHLTLSAACATMAHRPSAQGGGRSEGRR
ncbi:hypothetical protein GCM10011392_14870 [Wenxinia marina]|nr:hypothetical protein GCM10011392_14870 [Wenxinia marina]